MRFSEFREAVHAARKKNPTGDPDVAPFLYSIRVVSPADFNFSPQKFSNPKIRESSVPMGFLFYSEIYQFTKEDVDGILAAFSHATEIEVKHSEGPSAAFATQRILLTA